MDYAGNNLLLSLSQDSIPASDLSCPPSSWQLILIPQHIWQNRQSCECL